MALNYLTTETARPLINADIKEVLFSCIQNNRKHKDYTRTVEVATKARAFTTGEGIDDYMRKFQQRESNAQFEQRKLLTQHIVPAVVNMLTFILQKVPRSPAVKLAYMDTKPEEKKKLETADGNYYAKNDFKNYLGEFNDMQDSEDPNQWLVHEYEGTDGTTLAQPYPYLVSSEDAIDYEFYNGNLNYLICKQEVEYKYFDDCKIKTAKADQYTIYTPIKNVVLFPYTDDATLATMEDGQEKELQIPQPNGTTEPMTLVRLNKKLYILKDPGEHNLGHVQARRVGFKKDKVTKGNTFVPFWWNAEKFLMKLIKSVSEFDLTTCLHTFPQKFQYVPKCSNAQCNKGHLPDETRCPTCQGKGYEIHTSAQDAVVLALPDDPNEIFDLQELVNYVFPPTDGLEFMNKLVLQLIDQAKEAVYNSDVYTKAKFEATATGKTIDLQSIYDTIYPYARNYADAWAFGIDTFASIIKIDKEALTILAVVEKDFRFKTAADWIAELTALKNSGASMQVIREAERGLMETTYSERPSDMEAYTTKERFNPFAGKSESDIIGLMARNEVPKKKKILFANFGWIFDEAKARNEKFYSLGTKEQKEIVDAIVTEIEAQMPAEQPRLDLNFQ